MLTPNNPFLLYSVTVWGICLCPSFEFGSGVQEYLYVSLLDIKTGARFALVCVPFLFSFFLLFFQHYLWTPAAIGKGGKILSSGTEVKITFMNVVLWIKQTNKQTEWQYPVSNQSFPSETSANGVEWRGGCVTPHLWPAVKQERKQGMEKHPGALLSLELMCLSQAG